VTADFSIYNCEARLLALNREFVSEYQAASRHAGELRQQVPHHFDKNVSIS
jgi:hypothetical protein